MFEPKFSSPFPHSIDKNYHNPPQEVSVGHHHHGECNIRQILVLNSPLNQSWRGTNIQWNPWSPFKKKCRVCPQWPRRKRQWLNWPSHASSPVPYSDRIGIKPPTTPMILTSDPICIHMSNYKRTCATSQGSQDEIWQKQILQWHPQATNPGSLPKWLCGRSRQWKCWFCIDHNTRTPQ